MSTYIAFGSMTVALLAAALVAMTVVEDILEALALRRAKATQAGFPWAAE